MNWYVRLTDGGTRNIGLYPVPATAGYPIRIIYKKRPTLYSTASMSNSPEIEEDWQMLIVYGACARISGMGSSPDIDQSNNFRLEYNLLLREVMQARMERNRFYPITRNAYKRINNARHVLYADNDFSTAATTPNGSMTSVDPA